MLNALFRVFAFTLDIAEAWERFKAARRERKEERLLFGWCLDCGPEGTVEQLPPTRGRRGRRVRRARLVDKGGRPTFVTTDGRCERCGSGSVMNVRAGGDSAVRS